MIVWLSSPRILVNIPNFYWNCEKKIKIMALTIFETKFEIKVI